MFRRIDHVEIVPKDLERSIRFYSEVLGFRLKSRHPVPNPPMREVVYLTLGDTMLELIGADVGTSGDPEKWQVGFRGIALEVEDMPAALQALSDRGVAAAREPVDLGNSIRAEIRDPDGLIVELRQWK
ncbi:MAG: VOC family protein [Deltaproteobacteria bacterium]|nr:VOC family protein [Deltaproteobacteria bacterium]